ncbi:hypothetical protein [Bremerella cremea]|uniref:hypothetical protein n=1 Tax=Bremerella cremea TaxID=1031537 RepID=UPI0031E7B4AC
MNQSSTPQVPFWAHLLCGWPLFLVAVGGAVGGGLGGLAYGISISIFKTNVPMPVKIIAPVFIGMAAVVLYFVIAVAIFTAIQ